MTDLDKPRLPSPPQAYPTSLPAAQTATGVSPSDLTPVNGSAPSGPLHGTAAQPASPFPAGLGEGGRGPWISGDEYRLVAWQPLTDRLGRVRSRAVAVAIRTSVGWHVPTGRELVTQARQSMPSPRLSLRRSWVSADSRAEAEELLAYVARRAA